MREAELERRTFLFKWMHSSVMEGVFYQCPDSREMENGFHLDSPEIRGGSPSAPHHLSRASEVYPITYVGQGVPTGVVHKVKVMGPKGAQLDVFLKLNSGLRKDLFLSCREKKLSSKYPALK